MKAVQPDADRIDAGRAIGGCGGGRRPDDVHGRSAVVVLAAVHQGDAGERFDDAAEIVLRALVVPGAASRSANLEQHGAVHQQHGGVAIDGVDELVQLVDKRVGVAVHLRGGRQVDAGGQLAGCAVQQLAQTVEGAGHIAGRAGCRSAVNHEVVEIVAGCLDLLLRLEGQLVHGAGGVLKHAVNLEGTAHDDGLRGLFYALRLTRGVFGVDRAHRSGGRRFQLDIPVGQGRTARTRGDCVVKDELVEQQ